MRAINGNEFHQSVCGKHSERRRSPARRSRALLFVPLALVSGGALEACGSAPEGTDVVASASPGGRSAHRPVTPNPVAPPRVTTRLQHAVVAPTAPTVSPTLATPTVTSLTVGSQVDLKLLVISADGSETDYTAVTTFLRRIGIPFDTLVATQTPLTADLLAAGNHGKYEGIILATGNLAYFDADSAQWTSAFTSDEWQTLWSYEAAFGVRQVTSYTFPFGFPDAYGLNLVAYQDTTATPLDVKLTTAGQQVFSDLAPSGTFTIANSWTYLATPTDATTTPLLTTADGVYSIASVANYPDGRQNLTVTTANNPDMLHSMVFSYGIINWVTRGLFLGERHMNLDIQVDDLLIEDDNWDMIALSDTTGRTYRITGNDYWQLISWERKARLRTPGLTLEFAFNGEGATGVYPNDTLTPAVRSQSGPFNWVNHTYDHENLDLLTYDQSRAELVNNRRIGLNNLALSRYDLSAMVQPDVSGLYNAQFQAAAYDVGIRYLVSDTSRPGWNNPAPNEGFWSTLRQGLFIVPRRPDNLFYNVTTPEEWVSEYNYLYGPGGTFAYWDHNLSFAEIIDFEADMWLRDLISGSLDPRMFHQSNLRAYDGTNSLLGKLIDATADKYYRLYSLPIRNLRQSQVGSKMADRMKFDTSGVVGTLTAGATGCNVVLSTTKSATIPVTGVTFGTKSEVYGGQSISYVVVKPSAAVSIPTVCW